jgi:hypothetical protein
MLTSQFSGHETIRSFLDPPHGLSVSRAVRQIELLAIASRQNVGASPELSEQPVQAFLVAVVFDLELVGGNVRIEVVLQGFPQVGWLMHRGSFVLVQSLSMALSFMAIPIPGGIGTRPSGSVRPGHHLA